MNKIARSGVSRNAWGQWLRPTTATVNPPPPPPRIVSLIIDPPAEWPEDKRRTFGMVERSLLTNPLFQHLTVLPPGCIFVRREVQHNVRTGRATAIR